MRKAKPWYRKERDCWCVYLQGKLIALTKGKANKKEAMKVWHRLMAVDAPRPSAITIADLFDAYERTQGARHKPHTIKTRKCALASFLCLFGKLKANELTPNQIEQWIDHHPKWSSTTAWTYIGYLNSIFRWGLRAGLVSANVAAEVDRPSPKVRGVDCTISDEQHQAMLKLAWPALRVFLVALRETGARPGEVASVTAADFDAKRRLWLLRQHKTAHLGKQRAIFLTPSVVARCRTLAKKHPTGPLFRTSIGTAWNRSNLHAAMKKLSQRCGFVRRPIAYGYRHTFATDALETGVPDAHVAELLGHASTAMLHRHYSHLCGKTTALRNSLGRFRK